MQTRRTILPFLFRLSALLVCSGITLNIVALIIGATIHHQTVAIVKGATFENQLYLLDIRIGFVFRISNEPADVCCFSWSSDGTKIAFSVGSQLSIWDMHDGAVHKFDLQGFSLAGTPWWIDNQTLVSVLSKDYASNLFRIELNTGNIQQLSDFRGKGMGISDQAPDKSYFLFWVGQSGFDQEIYRINANGTNLQQITDTVGYNLDAAVSPNGQLIAYVSERGIQAFDISIMNPDGSHTQQITHTHEFDNQPIWFPDSKHILMESTWGGPSRKIYMMNIDEPDQQVLIFSRDYTIFPPFDKPILLPGATQILFDVPLHSQDVGLALYIVNVDGTDLHQIYSDSNSTGLFPAVQPQP
jgi:Tol biopolymer transport system component